MNRSSPTDLEMVHGLQFRKRLNAEESGSDAYTDMVIWLIFNIGGDQVLLTLLIATFLFSRKIARHPTVLNVCCIWTLTGIIASLLCYARQQSGPEPNKALCVAQAVLISPVPPMTSMAALALVLYTWSSFRPSTSLKKVSLLWRSRSTTAVLLVAPYMTFVCFAVGALHICLQDSNRVSRARRVFYCSVDFHAYNLLIAVFTAVVCMIATVLGIHFLFMLTRPWKAMPHSAFETAVDFQLAIRIVIFVAYVFCGSIVEIAVSVVKTQTLLSDMFAASAGTALFFVFATHPDVLRVWARLLCRHRGRAAQTCTESTGRSPTPLPSFDLDLLQPSEHVLEEKGRLAALHAYYNARVHLMGIEVEVIRRPEDAFVVGKNPGHVWGLIVGKERTRRGRAEAWWSRSFDDYRMV